jgi:Kef-type K+ transport system membrane component KefB
MPEVGFGNLFVVALVAFLAPLLLGFAPRLRIPSPVLEIVAGVVLGPSVLGWVHADLPVQVLAVVGLAFLLFLAGLEIDVRRLRGRPLTLSLMGYGITLVLGVVVGLALGGVGWVVSPLFVAITLSATSLGLVVPVLKDAGAADTAVGRLTIAAASVADFAAVLLLSLLFSASGSGTGTGARLILLGGFCVLVVVVTLAVRRSGMSMRLGDVLTRLQDTTAEIRVRACVLLLLAFVALASRFGLETILGAFVAGAVVGMLDRDSSSHPHLRTKLEAIGYGFLVPVFFVASGLRLDLTGLLASPSAIARVPVFLVALLAVRGLAALPYLPVLGRRSTLAAALLQATSLPFIVTATQIGVVTGRMSAVTAAALVTAGLLSVLLFPAAALVLLRQREPGETSQAGSHVPLSGDVQAAGSVP